MTNSGHSAIIELRGYYTTFTTQQQIHIHNTAYTYTTGNTQKGARAMENNALILQQPGTLQAVQGFTSGLFERWIAYIDAKPKTVETYTRAIRQFATFLQVNGITEPTRDHIIAYRDALRANHKPTTIQAYIMAVKLFFQWTEQEGLYPDIAKHIKGAKLDRDHKKDYLTPKQVSKLLASIGREGREGLRDYAIIALMVTSGLRTVEVMRANIEDIRTVADFTALYIQGKGHEEKNTYVKLVEPVEDAIRVYLDRNIGERMTTRSISRIVKNALRAAGFNSDRLTAHSLRHTTATLNLLNGGTVEETQQLLRHTNINTTMIYSHALERAKNNSEERVAKAIFG